ncbi:hypothetical protein [Nocardia sp. GTS18]|uniref:hypothetical protein n=1 Tax=Nocardia sp. GTS18 TaxID=1778064 RepID=UPI0015EEB3CE|nr:hypothetical protein [Nocardia sp. GTS18]
MKPIAIGFLRSDISGTAQNWDEIRIRSLAKRYGYDLAKTIVFGVRAQNPVGQLVDIVRRTSAEAIFAPTHRHLDDEFFDRLVRACDVVTVEDGTTYARSYVSCPSEQL